MPGTTRRAPKALATVSLVLAGAVGASSLATTGASARPRPDGAAPVLAKPLPGKGKGWIQGTVVDRAGRRPLDVKVEAFAPGSSTPAATALTYAGPNIHGDEVDGFFRLVVPKGEYVLKFSTPGRKDPYRTVRDDKQRVEVGAREVVAAGQTLLTLERKADVTVTAALSAKRVRKGRTATVTLGVTSPDVVPVTGDVEVRVGKKVLTDSLERSDKGAAQVVLPRMRPGAYKVSVRYLGNDFTKPGVSPTLTLKVLHG